MHLAKHGQGGIAYLRFGHPADDIVSKKSLCDKIYLQRSQNPMLRLVGTIGAKRRNKLHPHYFQPRRYGSVVDVTQRVGFVEPGFDGDGKIMQIITPKKDGLPTAAHGFVQGYQLKIQLCLAGGKLVL